MYDLENILQLPDRPAKTAALAEWVQALYPEGSPRPVLVGGAAVELLTKGAYTTGDLVFVGELPSDVESKLRNHGFKRHGRHWIHDEGRIFIDFPADRLEGPETSVEIELNGSKVEILSPEAVLVDRLSAWAFWRSEVDALNAVLLWREAGGAINRRILGELVRQRGLEESWDAFHRFVESIGDRTPREEELEQWIRDSKD